MAAMSPCIVKGDGRTIVQFNVSQIGNGKLLVRSSGLTREWLKPCADPLPSARKRGRNVFFSRVFLQTLKRDRVGGSPEIRGHDTKRRKSSTGVLFSGVAVS
jgi:hypothetical protein